MTVIKTTNSIDELVSVIEMVDSDIAKWRSKDTGGSDGTIFLYHVFWLVSQVLVIYYAFVANIVVPVSLH